MGVFGWPWCWFIGRKTHTIPVCSSCLKSFFLCNLPRVWKKDDTKYEFKNKHLGKETYMQFDNILMDVICFYTQTLYIYTCTYIFYILYYTDIHLMKKSRSTRSFTSTFHQSFFNGLNHRPFLLLKGFFPSRVICVFFHLQLGGGLTYFCLSGLYLGK